MPSVLDSFSAFSIKNNLKFLAKSSAKNKMKHFKNTFLFSEVKSTTLPLPISPLPLHIFLAKLATKCIKLREM